MSLRAPEAYRERLLIEGLSDAFTGFSESMVGSEKIDIPLENLHQPALVIVGRHDEVVPLESCRRAAERLSAKRFVILENSGHSSPEEEPEIMTETILDFHEGLSS